MKPGGRLTKRYHKAADGAILKEGTPKATWFDPHFARVAGVVDLFALLDQVRRSPRVCIIRAGRGPNFPDVVPPEGIRRTKVDKPDYATRWAPQATPWAAISRPPPTG